MLSQVAMKTAAEEKITGMKAAANVTKAGINAYEGTVTQGNKIEVFNKNQEIKNKQRMAGGIAAIGKYAAVGFLSKDNDKGREYPTNTSAKSDLIKASSAKIKGINAEQDAWDLSNNDKPTSRTGRTDAGKVTPGSTDVTPSDGTGIRSQAFNYLTGTKGLSKNKALGILANVDRESGWNPSVRSGDDGGPGGLFQWKGSRQTATVAGLVDSGDWKGQLDYALSEPGEAFSQTYQQTTYNSPQQAADAWMTQWERPADTASGSRKHTQFLGGYNF
jgi:hypothetical protein